MFALKTNEVFIYPDINHILRILYTLLLSLYHIQLVS